MAGIASGVEVGVVDLIRVVCGRTGSLKIAGKTEAGNDDGSVGDNAHIV